MRSIPALIVPFRMIRAEYFVLRTLPLIASFNPITLVERNRRNLLRLWLRTEIRVLGFDLLHLLRIGLLRRGPRISPRVLLAGCRDWWSCTCRCRRYRSSTRRCLGVFRRRVLAFPALLRLMLPAGRRTGRRLTGNVRFRTGGLLRFRRRLGLLRL